MRNGADNEATRKMKVDERQINYESKHQRKNMNDEDETLL